MDDCHFDNWTRSLESFATRRTFTKLLAGGTFGALLAQFGRDDGEAKKRKKKQPRPKPNQFGCLDVGVRCKQAGQCCSGICAGKRGKRKCRAHDQRLCTPERNLCTAGVHTVCNGANVRSACLLTTGKAAFCGDLTNGISDENCRRCSRDTECQAEFGPGAACVNLAGGICTDADVCAETGGTACVPSGA